MSRGFTLVETIIYIGLFGLLIGGGMLSTYQILSANMQQGNKATIQQEEDFVMRKIDWALSGVSKTMPSFAGNPSNITIPRYDGNTVSFQLTTAGGKKVIEMSESALGGAYVPITTDNVTVNGLAFTYIAPSGTGPAGITASTTINSLDASTTKFIRQ